MARALDAVSVGGARWFFAYCDYRSVDQPLRRTVYLLLLDLRGTLAFEA